MHKQSLPLFVVLLRDTERFLCLRPNYSDNYCTGMT